MRRRPSTAAWAWALALLVSCQWSCEGPPAPSTRTQQAPQALTQPRVSGDVIVPLPGRPDGSPGVVEVRFVAEEPMKAFLDVRLEEGRRETERSRHTRERLRDEVARLAAEKDRAEAAWRYKIEEDLRRRLELQFRPPARVEDYHATRRAQLADKRATYDRAVRAVARAEEKERLLEEEVRAASRFRSAGFLTEGLPPAVLTIRTDEAGRFEAALAPGRYAVVAHATVPWEPPVHHDWLLWVNVAAERETRLGLRTTNLHGTGCAGCIVPAGELTH